MIESPVRVTKSVHLGSNESRVLHSSWQCIRFPMLSFPLLPISSSLSEPRYLKSRTQRTSTPRARVHPEPRGRGRGHGS